MTKIPLLGISELKVGDTERITSLASLIYNSTLFIQEGTQICFSQFRDAITKYHRLGRLTTDTDFSQLSGLGSPRSGCQDEGVLGEGPFLLRRGFPHIGESKRASSGFFLFVQGHKSSHAGCTLMTASEHYHLPKASPPMDITLGVRASTQEF